MKLTIPAFEQAKLLVVGDLMLDRYWQGATSRISPEAPVPVVKVNHLEARAGGAGNVALNIAAFGAQVVLDGVAGADEAGEILRQVLIDAGVECQFERLSAVPTITKLRVLSRHQQLLRMDFEEHLGDYASAPLVARFRAHISQVQVVVLSDYAKGTLASVAELIQIARVAGVPVLVDPKGSDFAKYRGATLLTPNLSEFEAVVGPCADDADLVAKGEALRAQLHLEALLITRSERGMTLLQQGCEPLHLPAQAREVFDVTGAGDTVISVLAASLAAGLELSEATALANLAAGIVVGKLGTATVSVAELRTAIRQLEDGSLGERYGVLSEEALLHEIAHAKALGERIVMTNGCFDILHAGHVGYLEHARQLGDRLIVAVNDDASVSRLKGPTRPIVPLSRRMQVLAALRSVDWVVPFSEDTPERLIGRVLPDVLVKGGDYTPEQIAGHKAVRANGGEVVVLGFEEGCSTSEIIARICETHPRQG
ncbi:MAG: bifunctional D-glycero-beta-D-manno-heptose-7-phosphate kinase/D-glycero-beta-D-manno-heptose 1-phosphate adenylyltransferase HldE [Pseudomonadota bacterium]